jgi:trigger factor
VELQPDHFIPGFSPRLVGLSVGQTAEFTLDVPAGFDNRELAGRPAVFRVRLQELKEKVPPELDDEFAKSVGNFADVEALRAGVTAELEASAARERELALEAAVLSAITDATAAEVPDALVERELDRELRDVESRLAEQGLQLDAYLRYANLDIAGWRAQERPDAERRAKLVLALDAIARQEGVTPDEKDVAAEAAHLKRAAQKAGDTRAAAVFDAPAGRSYVRERLRRRMVVDLLKGWAVEGPAAPAVAAGEPVIEKSPVAQEAQPAATPAAADESAAQALPAAEQAERAAEKSPVAQEAQPAASPAAADEGASEPPPQA